MKIGLTSTSFRHIKDLQKIVLIAKQAGAHCIEWGGDIHVKSIQDARLAKRLCDENGISISSYGSYYCVGCENAAEWKRLCEIADAMGAKSIRVWLGKKSSRTTTPEDYAALLRDCKSICEEAAQRGITVTPECHNKTYNDSTDAFLKFQKDLGMDNLKTYFQSRYLNWGYDEDRIKRTLPHTSKLHVSYSERMRMQFFGKKDKGYVDKIIELYKTLGYGGIILVEYTFFASPKRMLQDIERIRRIWGD